MPIKVGHEVDLRTLSRLAYGVGRGQRREKERERADRLRMFYDQLAMRRESAEAQREAAERLQAARFGAAEEQQGRQIAAAAEQQARAIGAAEERQAAMLASQEERAQLQREQAVAIADSRDVTALAQNATKGLALPKGFELPRAAAKGLAKLREELARIIASEGLTFEQKRSATMDLVRKGQALLAQGEPKEVDIPEIESFVKEYKGRTYVYKPRTGWTPVTQDSPAQQQLEQQQRDMDEAYKQARKELVAVADDNIKTGKKELPTAADIEALAIKIYESQQRLKRALAPGQEPTGDIDREARSLGVTALQLARLRQLAIAGSPLAKRTLQELYSNAGARGLKSESQ